MVMSFVERVNQGESLASWLNWLSVSPLLCAGLCAWGTYHLAEKEYSGPSRGFHNVTTKLCCVQHALHSLDDNLSTV